MHRSLIPYFSWIALVLAIALWAGVGYFLKVIADEEFTQTSRVSDAQQESVRQEAMLRIHAIARETKDARAELEKTAQVGVVEILETIERVGRDAGVSIEIGEVLSSPGTGSASIVRSAAFVVESEGTFGKIMHAAALLESLPIPSSIDEIQFEQLPSSGSGRSGTSLWRLVVRMHFLTTADISS